MSERSWKQFLMDMLDSVHKATTYVAGQSYADFLTDTKTQDAVVRNLEILGEAARRIPAHIQQGHPEIPWRQIAGLRNRLAHGYFAVDYAIVWDIVTNELPLLKSHLEKLLPEADS